MKITQKQIIHKFLKSIHPSWSKAYDLRGRNTEFGFCGHQADRRAREMAESGEIEVRHDGKYAEYRSKVPLKVELWRVAGTDTIIRKVIG